MIFPDISENRTQRSLATFESYFRFHDVLKRFWDEATDEEFAREDGTHISSQYDDDMFSSFYKPLGLPRVDLYSLRHFSITKKLAINGHDYVSLAKDTAHRQLSTIQDYYETPEDSVRIDTAKAIGKFLIHSDESDSESKVTISLEDEDFAKKLEEVASDSAGKQMLEFAIAMYEKNNSGK